MVFTGSFAGRQILAVVVLLAISIPSHAAGPAPTAPTPDATSRDYVLWYRNFDSPAILALVRLALEKTPEYGGFRVLRSAVMVQERALRELTLANSTAIDIANVATNSERERKLVAIPIPIDGGLLGLRVCVTLQDKLPLFEGIQTINDLRTRGLSIRPGAALAGYAGAFRQRYSCGYPRPLRDPVPNAAQQPLRLLCPRGE